MPNKNKENKELVIMVIPFFTKSGDVNIFVTTQKELTTSEFLGVERVMESFVQYRHMNS